MIEGEEIPDEVQQPSQPETTEAPVEQEVDAVELNDDTSESKVSEESENARPHPLGKDGDRFKQIWARSKAAEARATQVESELRQEREERIRLEERLKVQAEVQTKAQPKVNWEQLEGEIEAGRLSRGQAMAYWEKQLRSELETEFTAKTESVSKLTSLGSEMAEYKSLVPNLTVHGTEERNKVEREYGYLVQRLGTPQTKEAQLSMEAAAARAAFGDLDTLKTKKSLSAKPQPREAYLETSSAQRKPTASTKDPKAGLTAREVAHYERMMKNGRYPGGWADVQKEHQEYDQYKQGQR